jgi:hypothetical protein
MQITGIEIEKDQHGEDAFIRIDLRKYKKQLQPFLEEVGLVKSDFEKEWEEGIIKEELLKRVDAHLNSLPWNKSR